MQHVNRLSTARLLTMLRPFWKLSESQGDFKNQLRRLYGFSPDLREKVLRACDYACEYCARRRASHVDHRLSIFFFRYARKLGIFMRRQDNAQGLCYVCHRAKEYREEELARTIRAMLCAKTSQEEILDMLKNFLREETRRKSHGKNRHVIDNSTVDYINNQAVLTQAEMLFRRVMLDVGKRINVKMHEKNWRSVATGSNLARLNDAFENVRAWRRAHDAASRKLIRGFIRAKGNFERDLTRAKLSAMPKDVNFWRNKARPELQNSYEKIKALRAKIFSIEE